jgi:molecular chaperone GrpE (heat shock protein)
LGATLNWRPVRDIEARTSETEIEILRVRKDSERIRKETEQLRRENARLRIINAKAQSLLSCVDQLCFPPESSSTHPPATEADCGPSSP